MKLSTNLPVSFILRKLVVKHLLSHYWKGVYVGPWGPRRKTTVESLQLSRKKRVQGMAMEEEIGIAGKRAAIQVKPVRTSSQRPAHQSENVENKQDGLN